MRSVASTPVAPISDYIEENNPTGFDKRQDFSMFETVDSEGRPCTILPLEVPFLCKPRALWLAEQSVRIFKADVEENSPTGIDKRTNPAAILSPMDMAMLRAQACSHAAPIGPCGPEYEPTILPAVDSIAEYVKHTDEPAGLIPDPTGETVRAGITERSLLDRPCNPLFAFRLPFPNLLRSATRAPHQP